MIILDLPRTFNGSTISIPLYHRGHLSLFPGATVWLCLLPGSRERYHLPEIVISPIDFAAWTDLWRLTVTLRERIGLVHEVFDTLKHHDINVVAAESSSMDRQRLHSLEVVVDATRYTNLFDGDHAARASGEIDDLFDLRRALLARLLPQMVFDSEGEPRIKIRRVRSLFETRRDFSRAQEEHFSRNGLKPIWAQGKVEKTSGSSVRVVLPSEVRASLHEALTASGRDMTQAQGHYLLVSETADRFLRAYFVRQSNPILAAKIRHEERIGALATITEALYAAKFNILTSLSRLYHYGTQAEFELVLQPPAEVGSDEQAIRRAFENCLVTSETTKYQLEIGYAPRYGVDPEYKPVVAASSRPGGAAPAGKSGLPRSTLERLKEHHLHYGRIVRSARSDVGDMHRFQLAAGLLAEESSMRPGVRPPRSLFVSYAFADASRFKRVKELAPKKGFNVVTGNQLGPGIHRDEIMRLMYTCTHYLGIWTEDGGIQMEDDCWWPSPWLHWEFGAAEAAGLEWQLLISNKIDERAWRKISADVAHERFDPGDFDKKLRLALKKLDRVEASF